MRPDDFFVDDGPGGMFGVSTRSLNVALLEHLRRGPLKEWEDVEVAVPLTRPIHDDLERYGTDGGQEMTEQQMRAALLALRAVVDRLASLASRCHSATSAPSGIGGFATALAAAGAGKRAATYSPGSSTSSTISSPTWSSER